MSLPAIVGGYQLDQFVEQDLLLFQCGICTLVCKETVSLPCNHGFCRECIGRWVVTNHDTCPYCRSVFNGHNDMKSVTLDPVLQLQVRCDNKGCTWIGKICDREHHKKQECLMEDRRIACPCCKFYGPVEEYRNHKCDELKGECIICTNLLAKLCITCEAEKDYTSEKQYVCNNTKQVCNHHFHDHCLARWARKRYSCPLCDGIIDVK
jgi:hypothetical protein